MCRCVQRRGWCHRRCAPSQTSRLFSPAAVRVFFVGPAVARCWATPLHGPQSLILIPSLTAVRAAAGGAAARARVQQRCHVCTVLTRRVSLFFALCGVVWCGVVWCGVGVCAGCSGRAPPWSRLPAGHCCRGRWVARADVRFLLPLLLTAVVAQGCATVCVSSLLGAWPAPDGPPHPRGCVGRLDVESITAVHTLATRRRPQLLHRGAAEQSAA